MSSHLTVIVNPRAGARNRAALDRALALLGAGRVVVPDSPEATTAAARDAEASGASTIVVAGGDGTIHCVVNGLKTRTCTIGLIPCGTANDLAHHMGVPADLSAAARVLLSNHVARPIDLVRINGVRIVTVGGMALAADAAIAALRLKESWPGIGPAVYKFGAARSILGRRRLRLRNPDRWVTGVFVVNQADIGGQIRLPCPSKNDDGVCEVMEIRALGRVRLGRTLIAVARNRPAPPGAFAWQATSGMRMEFEDDVACFGDGEDLGRARVFEIAVEPGALRVHAPG